MSIRAVVRWSLVGVLLLVVAAAAYAYAAYSRSRFPGQRGYGPPIALVGGRLYDPERDTLIEGATVVVAGRQIVAVGKDAAVPEGARVLHLRGLTLLPGLIDSHVHLSGIRTRTDGSRELGWLRYLWEFVRRFPERRRAFIAAGVTTVKSLGDPYPWVFNLAERIERHDLAGPRVFAAGPLLTAPGGHPVASLRRAGQGDTSYIAQVARQLPGPAEATLAVDQLARRVDFVSATLEDRGDPTLPRLPTSTLQAIVASAHKSQLRVLAHISRVGDVDVAALAGADGIEHVPFDEPLDSFTIELLRAQQIVVDPTLQATEELLGEFLHDTAAARLARQNTRRLIEAGVPLVAGSDAPSPGTSFGFALHEELRNLVEAGLTPGAAIAAATSVAAAHLGLADSLGTIAPCKWADIIAVGGEPLTEIEATADVYLVIADGQILLDRLDEVRRSGTVIAMRRAAGPAESPR
jgi:enamidase